MDIRFYKLWMVPALVLLFSHAALRSQTATFTPTNVSCNGAADASMKIDVSDATDPYWFVCYDIANPANNDSVGPTNSTSYSFLNLEPDKWYLFVVKDDADPDYWLGYELLRFSQPDPLSANYTSTNINCFGAKTGTITITDALGGYGQYDYTVDGWTSFQTTGSFSSLAAGFYDVEIRDRANPGCVLVLNDNLEIKQNPQLNATITTTNPKCAGVKTGSIELSSPTGGTGTGYQYTITGTAPWSAATTGTYTYTTLGPGTYNVVMRDFGVTSCTRTLDNALVITEPTPLATPDIVIQKGLTCNEGSDGELRAVQTGGTTPYTYTWQKHNGSIYVNIGQTTQVATNLNQGRYRVLINDANLCGPSNAVEYFMTGFTDSIPPVFYHDGSIATTTCDGQSNGSIDISAHGGKKPYRFSITTGGASGYQADSLFGNLGGGTYQSWVMDRKGCKKSGPDVTVGVTPNSPVSVTILANPTGAICPATSVTFTATPVNGGTSPSYQWKLNGTNVGTNSPTYTSTSLANGNQVSVVLTSNLRCTSGNPATSNTYTASLLTPPSISGQPASQALCAGANVTFTVTAAGSGLTYQWRKNGTNITGATLASYTINSIAAGDAGNYSVVVTGTCGTVTSNNAALVVNPLTAITVQPVALTQCAGTNATFTVTAVGTNLTYQWRKNGTNITGANSASYTINNIAAGDAGNYSVVVSGDCGANVTSNNALLTVNPLTAINTQPLALTQCAGTNATFTVVAVGANLTYQWRKNGTNITGATSASYTINNISAASAGNYSVVVTGTCGTVTSNNAALVVNPQTAITVQPVALTQCAGTNATFTVTAVGTNLTYQWRKNGTNITGANSASYTINNIAAGDAGNYSVVVSGDCGANVTSNNALLTVNPLTAITVQPVGLTQCAGTNATFTVTAVGTNLTYQWRKNGTNITGATSASYTINNISAANAGNYSVVVSGNCGASVTSDNALLTVNPLTAITAQPAGLTQCVGTNATFTVTAVGTNLTYQWRKNGTDITGATLASYTINNIAAGDAGNYSVVVSGDCGASVTSNNALLTVNPLTAINTQPLALTQCAGTNATFTVAAVGANLTYQWRKDGTNITGATSASYTINNISAANAGNYSVVVSGSCGASVTSNNALLTVNPLTAINTQPSALTQCAGTNATFTVTAVGTNLTYQWRKNGTDITGATLASYTINNIAAGDAGNYSVVVSGDCGANVTSNNALLTVNPLTAINTQPLAITQCTGTNATFTVAAVGTNLTYQWRKDGTNISGATLASYTINNIAAGDAGNYSVIVSGDCGADVTSNNALLTVNPLTAINTQPLAITQCAGTDATFTVTAVGTNLTYQWRKNGTNISGATLASYTINNIAAGDAGNYSVVVSGDCGANVTSNNALLTVNPLTAINTQPLAITQCVGTNATFTVAAVGTNLTYQWRKDGTDITGATSASYTINNIAAVDAGNYTVLVSGDCGVDVLSAPAALVVNPLTAITAQPVGLTECEGNNVTFTVAADGAALLYQWRKNGTDIPGANNNTYTITGITTADEGNYSVVVSGSCGTETSVNAVLTVNNTPVVTTQPVGITECPGQSVTFTVAASGLDLTYLWRKDGIPLSPAVTTASLTLSNIVAGDAGSYDVVITNPCGSIPSNAAILTVAENPVVTTHPDDQDLCEGGDVSFTVAATGTGISYQWRKDGENLAGETGTTLNLTAVKLADAGNYDVLISGLCGNITSNPAVLIVYPATRANIIDSDTIVCKESNVELNVAATGYGSLTYQWQRWYYGSWIDMVDDARISGTTTPDLNLNVVDIPDSGLYRVMVQGGCGAAYSDTVRLDINSLIATIGTPAPFLINSLTTFIEVGVIIEDHFLKHDLGFSLIAPDGTEVILKAPDDFCVPNHPVDVDVKFNTDADPLDIIDYCVPTNTITGTYAATGKWNLLDGMDPSNGAWQVRVYDAENANGDVIDGVITSATLTFIDLDNNGDTAVVSYNSGSMSTSILNPISGELRPTSYVVPIRLMTTCFNSEDAHAVVTVQGGIAPYTYEWTGPTSVPDQDDVMLGKGTYSVLVTDALGCTSIATVEVSSPPDIVFDDVVHTDTIVCHGSPDGIIRSKASGGAGSFTYTLLPGNLPSAVADSGVFYGLTAGIYTIRATDINGCVLDSVIQIFEHAELTVQIDLVQVTAPGTGSITLTASGGKPPYRYSIDNGATLQKSGFFPGLDAGLYQVYVVDTLGCTYTETVNLSIELLDVTVTKDDVTCGGYADGSFLLVMNDGVAPYTLTGSFTQTTNDMFFSFTGLEIGSYDIRIEDSEGRVFIETIEINGPAPIVALETISDATCSSGSKDGAIKLEVSGGASSVYTYEWSNGAATKDLLSIDAGDYHVSITDETSCVAEFDYVVGATTFVHVDAGDDATICSATEYQLEGEALTPDYDNLLWTPGNLLNDPAVIDPIASITRSTKFYLTLSKNGCSHTDSVTVSIYEPVDFGIYRVENGVGVDLMDSVVYIGEGESVSMFAGNMENLGIAGVQWIPETYLDNPSLSLVTATPPEDIKYIARGTTDEGCREYDTVRIILRRPIKIYTGFSPNEDGVNDTWEIENAEGYGELIRVRVYNRWGEPVFESKGYGGSQEWDGTRNGRPMPVGSYYYIIDVKDGKSDPYTGTVTILR